MRDGEPIYTLNLCLPVTRMTSLLRQTLEDNRVAGIVDQNGIALARTEKSEQLVGRPIQPDWSAGTSREGIWRGPNADGTRVHIAFARSRLAGW